MIKPFEWYGEEHRSFGGTMTETRRVIYEGRARDALGHATALP